VLDYYLDVSDVSNLSDISDVTGYILVVTSEQIIFCLLNTCSNVVSNLLNNMTYKIYPDRNTFTIT